MSIRGYSSSQKNDRTKAQNATVEPVREHQHGISVVAHAYVREVTTSTAVEANSTPDVINATAHTAIVGDVIRFTSGALNGREVRVYDTTANTIALAETLSSAPATGVTFKILRHIYAKADSDGNLFSSTVSSGPVQFVRNGSTVSVIEDDVTPANNQPLPVKLTGVTGDVNITAGDLNVNISHTGAGFSSVRIGDGTTLAGVTLSNELKTSDATAQATLSAISGKLPASLGQKTSAASFSVVLASDQGAVPVSQSGTWNINNISGTISLPTGASTEATLSALNGKVNSNFGASSGAVRVASQIGNSAGAADFGAGATSAQTLRTVLVTDQTAIPVSQSGTWNINNISGTISLPTGAATEATLSTISGKLPASLGQKTMAASFAVVIASDQTAVPASQSGTWNINNISGTISLPTGASTEATLAKLTLAQGSTTSGQSGPMIQGAVTTSAPSYTTAQTSPLSLTTAGGLRQDLSSIAGTAPLTGNGTTGAGSLRVTVASDNTAFTVNAAQSGTWNINNISGTISLPTGASTEATLSTLNGKVNQDFGASSGAVRTAALLGNASGVADFNSGLKGAQTVRVIEAGRTAVDFARNDYTSTNVTAAAYTQLKASLAAECTEIEIFDSSGQTLFLATGGAGSEVNQIYIIPGGNGRIPLRIASGTRVAIKAVSATANAGEISVNFYS